MIVICRECYANLERGKEEQIRMLRVEWGGHPKRSKIIMTQGMLLLSYRIITELSSAGGVEWGRGFGEAAGVWLPPLCGRCYWSIWVLLYRRAGAARYEGCVIEWNKISQLDIVTDTVYPSGLLRHLQMAVFLSIKGGSAQTVRPVTTGINTFWLNPPLPCASKRRIPIK